MDIDEGVHFDLLSVPALLVLFLLLLPRSAEELNIQMMGHLSSLNVL
jgi:hypothetical protein